MNTIFVLLIKCIKVQNIKHETKIQLNIKLQEWWASAFMQSLPWPLSSYIVNLHVQTHVLGSNMPDSAILNWLSCKEAHPLQLHIEQLKYTNIKGIIKLVNKMWTSNNSKLRLTRFLKLNIPRERFLNLFYKFGS